jgi:hypothetical protein
MDDYINFELDGRKLKINKENPDDILIWKNNKHSNPRWYQLKVQTYPNGYKYIKIKPKSYYLHRINYYAHYPTWDIHNSCNKTNSIDHIDIDKTNNYIENLRVLTHQHNQWNRICKGCYWCKRCQKWRARIIVNGKQKYLGLFDLEEDAHQAYLEAKKIYHIIK